MSQPSFQDAQREQNGIWPLPNASPVVDGCICRFVH
jgi:hypothetical protein